MIIHSKLKIILPIGFRENRMIRWIIRNFITRAANVLKIHKTSIRPHVEFYTQAWAPLLRHWNWKQCGKNNKIKRVKGYSYSERLEELGLTTLRERMRGILIEIFKIMEFLIMVDLFYFLNILPWTDNLLSQQFLKTVLTIFFFFCKFWVKCSWKKTKANQIKKQQV